MTPCGAIPKALLDQTVLLYEVYGYGEVDAQQSWMLKRRALHTTPCGAIPKALPNGRFFFINYIELTITR